MGGRADQPPGARDPDNTDAKNLLAGTYTPLAYQTESGPWRDFSLAGDLSAVQALLGHLDTFELGIPIVTP